MPDGPSSVRVSGSTDPAVLRWNAVYARLQHTEGGDRADGGFNHVTGDRGGPTKYGLSLRFLVAECDHDPKLKARLDLDNNGRLDVVDVRGLHADDARDIYRSYFWTAPGFNTLPQPFDAAMFDQGVNGGCRAAVKLLQRTCDAMTPGAVMLGDDGLLGSVTRNRLDRVIRERTAVKVLAQLRKLAADRYRELVALDPTQHKFLAGWLTRAEQLGDV